MNRNILLIEPNYKNKFPPIALMKLSTYYKRLGDNVVFYKGEFNTFVVERTADLCINKLNELHKGFFWQSKRDIIINFIKTRKQSDLEKLCLSDFEDDILLTNWVIYYKDYYWKKEYLKHPEWDRIAITTLFTFYFDITVKTINNFKQLLKKDGSIMVGGVLATLQPKELEDATGIRPYVGLLNRPRILDSNNDMIVDELPLDYTILEENEYTYPMSNAFYGYMTRGCIRQCPFCAVPKLEPKYEEFIPLKERIQKVIEICGDQKDLLLMDNNVLASHSFDKIIDEIVECGFYAGAMWEEPDSLMIGIKNLKAGKNDRGYIRKTQKAMSTYLSSIKDKELSYKVYSIMYKYHVLKLETATKENLIASYDEIEPFYKKRRHISKKKKRTVDFNQGVDARLFTSHIAQQLSRIAISPLRIAFDNIAITNTYVNAIRMCVNYGMKNYSNYLLYNFKDKPVELYERMKINVDLCDELNINIYSFPMKYHPLFGEYSHNRDYIGEHWNRKYIRAVQAVLNRTKGSIGRGKLYFEKAFGSSPEEYLTLLEMPDTYIIYRFFFEWLDSKGHPLSMSNWLKAVNALSKEEQMVFYGIIHEKDFVQTKSHPDYGFNINHALSFYVNLRDAISKSDGELYKLKQEFDLLPKEEIEYIKTRRLQPLNKLVEI